METQQVTLWCKLLGKRVEVVLTREPHATQRPSIPEGWEAEHCLGRNAECYDTGCPFTLEEDVQDSVKWPFSQVKKPR